MLFADLIRDTLMQASGSSLLDYLNGLNDLDLTIYGSSGTIVTPPASIADANTGTAMVVIDNGSNDINFEDATGVGAIQLLNTETWQGTVSNGSPYIYSYFRINSAANGALIQGTVAGSGGNSVGDLVVTVANPSTSTVQTIDYFTLTMTEVS